MVARGAHHLARGFVGQIFDGPAMPEGTVNRSDLFDKKVHHRARSSMDSRSIGLGSLRLAILSHTPRHFAKKTRPVVGTRKNSLA